MVREDSHASAWNTSLGSDEAPASAHRSNTYFPVSTASQSCDAAWVVSRSAYGAPLLA